MNSYSGSGPACAQVRGMQQPNAGSTGAQDPDHAFMQAAFGCCVLLLRILVHKLVLPLDLKLT